MQQRHFKLALLMAVVMGLLFAQPAFGAPLQQHSLQAFRLLNDTGLIDVLPAKDSELAELSSFELANLLAGAAERLLMTSPTPNALPLPVLVQQYAASRQVGEPAARIAESLVWLEQCYLQELRILNKGPYFVAVSREALTGFNQDPRSECVDSFAGVGDVYVAPQKLGNYRLISPRAASADKNDLPVLF